MNSKIIVCSGFVLLAANSLFSRYNFVGHTGFVDQQIVRGTIHRAICGGAPKSGSLKFLPTDPDGKTEMAFLGDVQLDNASSACGG